MSDSFADLWSSSAPKSKPPTLGSASSSTTTTTTSGDGQAKKRPMGGGQPDLFSLLASSSSTTPKYTTSTSSNISSRSITPGTRPTGTTLISSSMNAGKPSTSSTGSKGGDAFGDIFSSASGSSNGQRTAQMTLAARLAKEAEQKRGSTSSSPVLQTASNTGGSDAWVGLDSLASGGLTKPTSVSHAKVDDDWDLGDFGAASSSKPSARAPEPPVIAPNPTKSKGGTLWDIDGLTSTHTSDSLKPQSISRSSSNRQTPAPPAAAPIADDWDLADFSTATTKQKGPSGKARSTGTLFDTPDADFDFGSREDDDDIAHGRGSGLVDLDSGSGEYGGIGARETRRGLLDSDDEAPARQAGEDDILGMLSRPIEEVKKTRSTATPSPQPNQAARSRRGPPSQAPRSSSPPPHVLGQIVEMGFSVAQARKALAATPTGVDVQAALDLLLSSNGAAPSPSPIREAPAAPAPEAAPKPRSAPKGFRERERERLERQRREADESSSTTTGINVSLAEVQEHADKLLSQASEVGINVLSKASAFWKGTVVKAYEERAGSAGGDGSGARGGHVGRGSGVGSSRGRPKWMQDVAHADGLSDEDIPGSGKGFIDDEPSPVQPRQSQAVAVESAPPQLNSQDEEVDLFSEHPSVSQSRPAPSTSKSQRPQQHHIQPRARATQRTPSSQSIPQRQRKKRTLPNASSSSLSSAVKHKQIGTEQFKLGQYGSACEAYTLAISAIPEGHLLLIPLFTNRSLARLRTGEYKGAEEDAEGALRILCSVSGSNDDATSGFMSQGATEGWNWDWNPSTEDLSVLHAGQGKVNEGGWAHSQGLGVDLIDGYIKAVKRRSEALEGRERWAVAGRGWEFLAGAVGGWVPELVKKEAARGAARCRSMTSGPSGGKGTSVGGGLGNTTAPASKPKPKPVRVAVSVGPSKALAALQASNAQAEADDTLRHQLKDSVDARLNTWKNGKETNIRALLASLDLVLWDEILQGGVKVSGLHALVTPAQVKKGYMKAIGRIHPDKLNSSNSTVEQRMLANGVFGTLNEAWLAFQATQS